MYFIKIKIFISTYKKIDYYIGLKDASKYLHTEIFIWDYFDVINMNKIFLFLIVAFAIISISAVSAGNADNITVNESQYPTDWESWPYIPLSSSGPYPVSPDNVSGSGFIQ